MPSNADLYGRRDDLINRFYVRSVRDRRKSDLQRQLQEATAAALRIEVARARASRAPEPDDDQAPHEPQWRLPYADN